MNAMCLRETVVVSVIIIMGHNPAGVFEVSHEVASHTSFMKGK